MSETPLSPTQSPVFWSPPRKKAGVIILILTLAIMAIALILKAWDLPPFKGGIEKTENAYIRGRTTVIAPQVSGYVVQVMVKDYEFVKANQVLAKIDDRIYKARVEQAKANLDAQLAQLSNSDQSKAARQAAFQGQTAGIGNARAQLLRAEADMSRVNDLVQDGSVSVREQDQTLAALKLAKAQVAQAQASGEIAKQDIRTVTVGRDGLLALVEAARAQLRLAEVDLSNTTIVAPEDGQVGEVGVRLGQYVTNGTQLLSLVPTERWIIANYKEEQTGSMLPGQSAIFTVDALDGKSFKGHIERLSPAAGSEFSVLKPDNATGNFVKVPQRIGVRITIDPNQKDSDRLRPGMSVEVRVDTKGLQS